MEEQAPDKIHEIFIGLRDYAPGTSEIDHQKKIDELEANLLAKGFPQEKIRTVNDRDIPNRSGILINTEGTLFSVEQTLLRSFESKQDPHNPMNALKIDTSSTRTRLKYGDAIFAQAITYLNRSKAVYDLWPQDLLKNLPVTMNPDNEERKAVVDEARQLYLTYMNEGGVIVSAAEHQQSVLRQLWKKRKFDGHHLEEIVTATFPALSEDISRKTHPYFLLNGIMFKVLNPDSTDDKYRLLGQIRVKMLIHKVQDDAGIKQIAKNFFYLAIQRNAIGKSNKTDSGELIVTLLNSPEFQPLRVFLFSEAPIKYKDIRMFVCGANDKKLFARWNRSNVLDTFWASNQANTILTNAPVERLLNTITSRDYPKA
jgi:hypothetical protein